MTSIQWGEWENRLGVIERNGVLGKWGIRTVDWGAEGYFVSVIRYFDDGDCLFTCATAHLPKTQLGGFACELIRDLVGEKVVAAKLVAQTATLELNRLLSVKEELGDYVFN